MYSQLNKTRTSNITLERANSQNNPALTTTLSATFFFFLPNDQASKKKRRSSLGASSPVLALGHTDGHISIYSLVHGRVIHQLSGSHTGKVNDFCFSKNGTRGFSAGEDGLICEWDIAQGVEMSKFQAETKSVKKIRLNHEEDMMLTAGHSMKLWDLESREVIKNFTGHASAITNVVFSANDKFLASTAEQDRFINLWDCTRENQQEGNITGMFMEASRFFKFME